MDLAPIIGSIVGGITLTGGLVLALLRYLTSDGGYRDLIGELRADNAALREQVDQMQKQIVQADVRAQARESELMGEIQRLQRMIAPPWPPPGGRR